MQLTKMSLDISAKVIALIKPLVSEIGFFNKKFSVVCCIVQPCNLDP